MSWLPRHLAPWAADLEDLSDPLWPQLEALSEAVGNLLGPRRVSTDSPDGELDGYDGLINAGEWDRLQLSEWALADTVPDEFLRRAASRELQFLRLRRRTPRRRGRMTVLVDCGPDQLGNARIGQLAVLLALAERARLDGVDMAWAPISPEPPHEDRLRVGFGIAEARGFLNARTVACWDEPAVEQWHDMIAPEQSDDLWWVGSAWLADAAPPKTSRVVVEEILTPDDRVRIRFEVRTPTRRHDRVLELPGPKERARLLRDPFERRRARPSTGGNATSSALLVPRPDRLILRVSPTEVVARHIPNAPGIPAGRARTMRIEAPHRLLGAGMFGKHLIGIVGDEKSSALLYRQWLRLIELPPARPIVPDASGGLLPVLRGTDGHVAVLDAHGKLWCSQVPMSNSAGPIAFAPVGDGVVDVAVLDGGINFLRHDATPHLALVPVIGGKPGPPQYVYVERHAVAAIVRRSGARDVSLAMPDGRVRLAEIEARKGSIRRSSSAEHRLPEGFRFLFASTRTTASKTLLDVYAYEPRDRAVWCNPSVQRQPLFVLPWPAARFAVDPSASRIVAISESAAVMAWSIDHRALLLEETPPEPEASA